METPSRARIMSPERVRRTLRRLAYEIVEHNRGAARLALFGILSRGPTSPGAGSRDQPHRRR